MFNLFCFVSLIDFYIQKAEDAVRPGYETEEDVS